MISRLPNEQEYTQTQYCMARVFRDDPRLSPYALLQELVVIGCQEMHIHNSLRQPLLCRIEPTIWKRISPPELVVLLENWGGDESKIFGIAFNYSLAFGGYSYPLPAVHCAQNLLIPTHSTVPQVR